ncbi:MAG: GNAT family N-acetyltransferase [Myxococcales bacterium]|nr:GNAT family N-acetyltransferase [Myxococcales bacterium]
MRLVRPVEDHEIELVAERMRATLVEVLGEARGQAMYTMDWLRDRVRFHLDPRRSTGAVLVAEEAGAVVGHTIVRVESDGTGLFSTTYVVPAARRRGVAQALLLAGEAWLSAHPIRELATCTARDNGRLIGLFRAHGYEETDATDEMVRLGKPATRGAGDGTDRQR